MIAWRVPAVEALWRALAKGASLVTGFAGRRSGSLPCLACLAGAAVLWLGPVASAVEAPGEGQVALASEVVRRQHWDWDPTGRRNPFIFRQPKEPERKVTDATDRGPIKADFVETDPTPEPTPETGEKTVDVTQQRLDAKKVAETLATRAFQELGRRNYAAVEEFTNEALNRMARTGLKRPRLEERLVRLHDTAYRLRTRAKVEEEFRGLKIVITGIVWQASGPVALVNGAVVGEGDIVLGAHVDEIRPNEVIFNLKGVRVSRQP
jgi:hypothetical protein